MAAAAGAAAVRRCPGALGGVAWGARGGWLPARCRHTTAAPQCRSALRLHNHHQLLPLLVSRAGCGPLAAGRPPCWRPPQHRRSSTASKDGPSDPGHGRRERFGTIPNLITSARLAGTPFLGYLLVTHRFELAAAGIFLAAASDWFDGWVARTFPSQQSNIGAVLDPLADKAMVATLTIGLAGAGLLPVPLTALILGRDAGLVAGGVYLRYRTLRPRGTSSFTLGEFLDFRRQTYQVTPSTLSKFNTAVQMSLLGLTLVQQLTQFDHTYIEYLWYLTGATTLGSGLDYIVNHRKVVRVLPRSKPPKSKEPTRRDGPT